MDEGADVFQTVRWDDGHLSEMVPRLRRRVRATYIFARHRAMPALPQAHDRPA